LPKMAEAAESHDLRAGFEEHLQQTKGHVSRLERIFQSMGEEPKRKKCHAMVGLIDEGDDIIGEDFEPGVKDPALISAAPRVEHYEIAAYGTVRTWAGLMGDTRAEQLLEQTLQEEKQTEEKLTKLSESKNRQATVATAGRQSN